LIGTIGPPLRDPASQDHGNRSLSDIQDEHQDPVTPAQYPTNVGGADVAAPLAEDIDAAPARNQVTEGNGTDEIRSQNGEKDGSRCDHAWKLTALWERLSSGYTVAAKRRAAAPSSCPRSAPHRIRANTASAPATPRATTPIAPGRRPVPPLARHRQ